MTKRIFTATLLLLIALLQTPPVHAGVVRWDQNGAAVSTAGSSKMFPAVAGDGSYGAFVVWEDYRVNPAIGDIYVQRIDVNGTPVSIADKDVTKDNLAAKRYPAIAKDGSGGAYVVWEDDRKTGTSGTDIYIQRINSDGNPVWSEDKVVCNATGNQWVPQIAPTNDGTGDVIIVWEDHRTAVAQIYAQRINKDTDTPVWTDNGIVVSPASGDQFYPAISSDGQGGAIVVWEYQQDPNADSDIYAQKLSPLGSRPWGDGGIAINSDNYDQWFPAIATDGTNFVITWEDYRIDGVYSDIYAKGIDSNGSQIFVDTAVSSASSDQRFPRIAFSKGENSFVIVWEDYRNDPINYTADIHAQKMGLDGGVLWAVDGEVSAISNTSQDLPAVASSDSKGVIAVWEDFRNNDVYDIYALQLPIPGSIKINNDVANTDTNTVTLTVAAFNIASGTAITQMCISNETSACPDTSWEPYLTTKYLTTTWSLDPNPGPDKTVYIQFKDAAGNLSPPYFDKINLGVPISDTTPPSLTITSPTDGSSISGTSFTIRGTASDNESWVLKVEVSMDGGTTWYEATGTTSWTYNWTPSTSGPYTIKARATDANGNPAETSVTVTVDISQPSQPIGLAISIEGLDQAGFHSYSNLIATWSPLSKSSQYFVSIGSEQNKDDIAPWEDNGNRTSYFKSDLQSLFEVYKASSGEYFGKTFYLNVKVGTNIWYAPFIYTPADINSKAGGGDGRVDGFDLGKLGIAYNPFDSIPAGYETADINRDGKVNNDDLFILAVNFGKVKP